MNSNEIRSAFIDYFVKEAGHTFVPSSSLVPHDDPTLLFANAGMNQFKQIFLGKETREYTRAANSQKCIRAGGKHNDLEDVGRDGTHLTFFEMLGNWSFGDYYKAESIGWGWDLLTRVLGLDKRRLWATVHHTDDEARDIWHKVTGLPYERILKFGDKDNFWEMAEVGPCGPCSEIHYYFGDDVNNQDAKYINSSNPDYIEIWNHVFIQYNRAWNDPADTSKGTKLVELPAKHVDTGMGFERLVTVLQGKRWVYDTDVFTPIIAAIEDIFKKKYTQADGFAHRAVADHIRCLTFAFTDGATPSNEDRGYVLRKILRRAVRQGWLNGLREPFLYKLVPTVINKMGDAFPEITERQAHVTNLIKTEEERFLTTVGRGIEIFHNVVHEVKQRGGKIVPGDQAFRLHDTYGFPLDLTIDLAESEQLSVDRAGFDHAMKEQQERSRATAGFAADDVAETPWQGDPKAAASEFIGYTHLTGEAKVAAWRVNPRDAGRVQILLDRTPFYAESGGQVGDQGDLYADGLEVRIVDTQKREGKNLHSGRVLRGQLAVGQTVTAKVDEKLRFATQRNHTATHLLHAALHKVIGKHAQQAGSLVGPDYMRFDFTHYEPIKPAQLQEIEAIVNDHVRRNQKVNWTYKSLDEAKKAGAMALFGEKYGETVRVVQIENFSLELCGGTHLDATGEIGLFVITSESGVAAGTRRIEVLTGEGAYEFFRKQRATLGDLCDRLKTSVNDISGKLNKMLEEHHDLHKELARLRQQAGESLVDNLLVKADERPFDELRTRDGYKIVSARVEVKDMETLHSVADSLRNKLKSGVGVLGAVIDGKGTFVCVVTDDLIKSKGMKAGDIVKKVAQITGGSGGGKPHFAQGSAKEIGKMEEALGIVKEFLK